VITASYSLQCEASILAIEAVIGKRLAMSPMKLVSIRCVRCRWLASKQRHSPTCASAQFYNRLSRNRVTLEQCQVLSGSSNVEAASLLQSKRWHAGTRVWSGKHDLRQSSRMRLPWPVAASISSLGSAMELWPRVPQMISIAAPPRLSTRQGPTGMNRRRPPLARYEIGAVTRARCVVMSMLYHCEVGVRRRDCLCGNERDE
jgi:hypothetical protein